MNQLLNKMGGFVRGKMEIVVGHTPASKSRFPEVTTNRVIVDVLTFGAKPTRGQIKALTKALKEKSLPVLHYSSRFHHPIDPSDIMGEVLSLRFKKNTNTLVVELYDAENRCPSFPCFQFDIDRDGKPVVLMI